MSANPSHQPMTPLSVGNVVSAALRIYRDRFKLYFSLALTAYLWVLIPIYGWARCYAIFGIISRLAFQELIECPESVDDARRQVIPRMWNFMLAGILVFLIFLVAILGVGIVLGVITGILGVIFSQNQNAATILVFTLIVVVGFILLLFGYLWLISRLFIVDVPLAIENNINASSAIGRSWELTKKFVFRIQGIVVVAFLICLPVYVLVNIVSTIAQVIIVVWLPQDSSITILIYYLLSLSLSFLSGAIFQPFWQTIKAVIYYDLRSRREGLGLQIRDST